MAKAGVVNTNFLSIEEVNQLVSEIDVLPYSNAIEAIEYSKPSIYTNNTLLLYVLSLPKVTEARFNRLIARANIQNGVRVELAYQTILTNKHQTFGIKEHCLQLSATMICEGKSLDLLPESSCLTRLLKGGQTSCTYATCNDSTVEIIKDDTIFLDNFIGIVKSGNNSNTLNGSYILQMDHETVAINGKNYSSTSRSGVQELPPILASVTNRSVAMNLNLKHGMTAHNIKLLGYVKEKTNCTFGEGLRRRYTYLR
ncbi:uncharacterized protein LOC118754344 [Rhagoletis pomonella]|uniref:uncharacterized protein LOC118754342 n=1 Tax=Rhagoletis pomonella TaxID=28610 RepID=UPI001783A9AA|nr:uncharacterized protein LOC118754342 [Rhagoletis pomonella]XP_036345110.1 uncharacterized protein LOC118754344 [Rhagoletis pomonella]